MVRRTPLTLWLYLLGDLWKLVLLTTAVLVAVTAFAAAVKPLADGKIGPEEALKFWFLAMVPMLQYALPFAACFGATLAYHRFASDNELTAAYAGGVSHRAMLMPAVISGLILGVILLALSNSIIPRFLQGMARLITQDVSKLMVNSIERGEAIQPPGSGTLIYADKAVMLDPDRADPTTQRLILNGLLVVQLDKDGAIKSQGSAREAYVWMRRASDFGVGDQASSKPMSEIIIQPKDIRGVLPGGRGTGAEGLIRMLVPDRFSDNVKFLSFSELRDLRSTPERIDKVEKLKRSLAMTLAEQQAIVDIDETLKRQGYAKFKDPFGQNITLKGGGLGYHRKAVRNDDGKITREIDPRVYRVVPIAGRGSGNIVVERELENGKLQVQSAANAFIRLPTASNPDRITASVTIQLLKVAAEQIGSDGEIDLPAADIPAGRGEVGERPLADLTFVGDETSALAARSTGEILALADQRAGTAKPAEKRVIEAPLGKLRGELKDLFNEVLSKEHERYAMSAACLVMILVGAVMALRLRDALPLTVYLWAFFPALGTILAISGGQQLTHDNGPVGLLLLWAGVIALGGFATLEFVRLSKH